MTQQAVACKDFDLALEPGRFRCGGGRRGCASGGVRARLSANLCGFDRLTDDTLQPVAGDLRGRGRSEEDCGPPVGGEVWLGRRQ